MQETTSRRPSVRADRVPVRRQLRWESTRSASVTRSATIVCRRLTSDSRSTKSRVVPDVAPARGLGHHDAPNSCMLPEIVNPRPPSRAEQSIRSTS